MAENYQSLIASLKEEPPISIELNDANLKSTIEWTNKEDKEYDQRNVLYSELLRQYIDIYTQKENAKKKYKCIFFWVTLLIFIIITIGCLLGICKISIYGDGELVNVGIAITNLAGIVSALLIIPKIIAEHLFPTDEESNMIGMVKNMQDNDANLAHWLCFAISTPTIKVLNVIVSSFSLEWFFFFIAKNLLCVDVFKSRQTFLHHTGRFF